MGKVYDALRRAETRRHAHEPLLPPSFLTAPPTRFGDGLEGIEAPPVDDVLEDDQEDELVERIASLEVAICSLYDRLDTDLPETSVPLEARLETAIGSIHQLLHWERASIERQVRSSTRRLGWLIGALSITVMIGTAAVWVAQH